MEEERRQYPPDIRVRVSLLEQWQKTTNDRAEREERRVDTLWDWRAEVKPTLKTTNRLLWTVLGVLVGNLGFSTYLLLFPHGH